jgi:D-alanyl-D-alanine carboxypeptidase
VTVPDRGDASTGGNDWGVQLGAFRSKGDAERQLLTTALQDVPHLSGGLRRVEAASVQGVTVYRAQFVGLDQQAAQQACQSITRQNATCETLAPGI